MLTKYWDYINFVQILCSYLKYTERLLNVFLLLLAVILSELHEHPRRKDRFTEKSTKNNLYEGRHYFNCTSSYFCRFLSFFCVLPPFCLLQFYVQKKFAPENGDGKGLA